MTKKELGQKIKEKYPAYNNLDDEVLADKIIEKYPVYKTQITSGIYSSTSPQPQPEQKKEGLISKAGKIFTGAAQKFAKTLGTAASVIDPTTKRLRQEAVSSTQSQVSNYLKMAQKETDKNKKEALLKAASYLSDTDGIDIYNNPEYQKTAKQIYGEALGTAVETLGWGKVGGIIKGAKTITAGQAALKGALTGGAMGALTSTGQALEENKTSTGVLKSAVIGGVGGALVGGAVGAATGKLVGKISEKKATQLVSEPLTQKSKTLAYKTGRATEAGLFKSEKILPTAKEKELGKIAQGIGLKVGKNQSNINKVNKTIENSAEQLKQTLKDTGTIYNKNNVKGTLNKMKDDVTTDLVDQEIKVYDKMINKFNKMVEASDNKGLDGLLEVRQQFDQWLKSNNPNIFVNKQGGAYRASKAVRESINNYINDQVKDNVVKDSLKLQSNLYTILENISKKAAGKGVKLKSSTVKRVGQKLKKPLAYGLATGAASATGLKLISGENKSNNYTRYNSGE